ncbi:MAG: thiamine pyrophosphate-binding protein [Deltaproteobacteria bacterium]|nr:thiamine pyrophosphate-binding protein [Deltaproteobacteria bacterium]
MVEKKPAYGSDLIVDLLKAFTIEYVALNPGASFRGLHDSLVNYGGNKAPEIVLCCHEEIAVSMAFGYARVTGKPMAAIVHNIVGLQHATMGIYNAWSSRVPVLVLGGTGPMDTSQRRSGADWVHTALVQAEQVRNYVKWDDQPASIASIPESFIRAYRLAVAEPQAPVYLCYDAALQESRMTEEIPLPDLSRYPAPLPLQSSEEGFEKTVRWLLEAKWPVIVADCVGRTEQGFHALLELTELLAIPVLDRGGRLNFPFLHPLNLTGAEGAVLARADLVLALDVADLFGALSERKNDSSDRIPLPLLSPDARVIHVSVKNLLIKSWAQDYDKLAQVDLAIQAETRIFLPELLGRLKDEKRALEKMGAEIEQRRAQIQTIRSELQAALAEETKQKWDEKPISMARLATEMAQALKGEDWVLTHSSSGLKEKHFLDCRHFNQFVGRRWHGGVGVGLPISLGAALALKHSGKLCVGVQPDGDFLFGPSALWTASHYDIPLLMIVFNNRSYYNDEEHQRVVALDRHRPVENRTVGIRLERPEVNFATLAQAYDIQSFGPVTEPGELGDALKRALRALKDTGRPVLLDVIMQNR